MAPRENTADEEPTVLPENKVEAEKPVKKNTKSNSADQQDSLSVDELLQKEKSLVSSVEIKDEAKMELETPLSSSVKQSNQGAVILGGGLLLMGIILLLGRVLSIPLGDFIWPFFFIIPGMLVFFSAVSSDSASGEGLAILGAILTALGLIFLVQQVTGLWASWAYAWALVAPTSIGVAQMIYGKRKDRDLIVQSGRRLINLGLAMFAIGFVFFELIIGINGFGINNFGLPVFPILLIFAGIIILIRALSKSR